MSQEPNEEQKKPRVHKDLAGFEISVSPTGQVISTHTRDQLNTFLNKYVKDKKLTPEQKRTQDDRMFPIQKPNTPDIEDDADDEAAFLRASGQTPKRRPSKKRTAGAAPDDADHRPT
jgi:hypothetical protein